MMPRMIRELFAVMISSCELSSPQDLWMAFRESMSEDFLHQAQLANPHAVFDDRIANQALICIEDKVFNASNRPLTQYGLPSPDRSQQVSDNKILIRETSYDPEEMSAVICTRQNSLTDEQAVALEAVMTSVDNEQGNFIFLDAPGD